MKIAILLHFCCLPLDNVWSRGVVLSLLAGGQLVDK